MQRWNWPSKPSRRCVPVHRREGGLRHQCAALCGVGAGQPAPPLLQDWLSGRYELITSPSLLDELQRVLEYPKLRPFITPAEADRFVWLVQSQSTVWDNPATEPPIRSADPGDDYLISLAAEARAILVTGDRDLLDLAEDIPVMSPREFIELLGTSP